MKRVISLVLVFLMMLSLTPPELVKAESSILSGITGDCYWSLDGTVLTISGSGEMDDYGSYSYKNLTYNWEIKETPWGTDITEVIIMPGVTNIGVAAFYNCTKLVSVNIANSVESIGGRAFSYCSGLSEIIIPDGVVEIGKEAFRICRGLTSVIIPDSVTNIDFGAFAGCDRLTSATLPNSATSIGPSAFASCISLTNITIPEGITSIGENAFYNCSSLNTVNFNAVDCKFVDLRGMTGVFSGCSKLTTVNLGETVTNIPARIFDDCKNLTGVSITDSVTEIGNEAFSDCTSLTDITIPDSVAQIGCRAFSGCTSLTSITIPESVTSIDSEVFLDCTALTTVNFNASDCTFIGGNGSPPFNGCSNLTTVNIGKTVTVIPEAMFAYCTSLVSITIPNNVTEIGDNAFSDCWRLTSITIPDSISSIGENAFLDCNIKQLIIADGPTKLTSAMIVCKDTIKEVVIPDSVTRIDSCAFSDCTSLTDVTIPDSVISIGWGAFGDCSNLQRICFGGYPKIAMDISIDQKNDPLYLAQWEYTRTCPKHVYDNDCTEECNICGRVRTPPHVYDNACDAACNSCENTRIPPHDFANEQNCSICRKPVMPTLEKKTDTSVTLAAFENYQYSLDGITWKANNVFSGLSPNTEYTFYQRLVDIDSYYISPASEALFVTTDKSAVQVPGAPTLESKTDTKIVLVHTSGYEYSKDGINWQSSNVFPNLTHNTLYTFYQRRAETNTEYASPASPVLQVETIARTATITYIIDQSNNTIRTQYKLEGIPITLGKAGRTGYNFCGWATKSYGAREFHATYVYNEEKDLTLYAVWLKICTVCDGEGKVYTGVNVGLGGGGTKPVYSTCQACNGKGTLKINHVVTSAPELENYTSWDVALKYQEDMEYSKDGITWQSSPLFTNLEPGVTYQFYQRYIENTYRAPATALCEPFTVTTKMAKPKAEEPVLLASTHDQVVLVQHEGMEYSMDGITWQSSNAFSGLKPNTLYTFYQRYAAEGEISAGFASDKLFVTTDNMEYIVVFKNGDGSVISTNTYYYGDKVATPADPTKVADETYTYTFAGWDKEVVDCTGNATYTATYTPNYIDYTVSFVDEDGAELSKKTYHWGDKITAPADPTKAADKTYTYSFKGWDKEIGDCAGDATYTATYNPVYIEYTVTFQYADGTPISIAQYHYGNTVIVPQDPTAPEADYGFVGWDKEIIDCAGNAIYTAVFEKLYVTGDIDGDEAVSQDDAVYLLLHTMFGEAFYPLNNAPADIDGSGAVDQDDAVYLLLHTMFGETFYPLNTPALPVKSKE